MELSVLEKGQHKMSSKKPVYIEEPMYMLNKSVACCLFGIPDPVESQTYLNSRNEITMMEFKSRWSFDPEGGEPLISGVKWEKVLDEEIVIKTEPEFESPIAQNRRPVSLLIANLPSSETMLKEMVTNTAAALGTSITCATDIPKQELEILPPKADDEHNTSNEQDSSMEQTSPNENKLRSGKTFRQCRITDYMKVTKKTPGCVKKLR